MVRLQGYGLRPWMEFELDPDSGRYTKRRLSLEPESLKGYAGFGQELAVRSSGTLLCAMFLHQQEMFLRVGGFAWNLFQPGLAIAHQEGAWTCTLSVTEPEGKQTTFRYRRKDWFLVILDSTYDQLDFELANLPANLPAFAGRNKQELIEWWSARAAG